MKIKDTFGFIQQDNGEADMFVLPNDCPLNTLPEVGTRVIYNVVLSANTNRPKAVDVELELVEFSSTGTMSKDKGKFGFINQDNGKGDLFVVPLDCLSETLPAVGTRVIYNVVMEEKSRALKVVDVRPERELSEILPCSRNFFTKSL